MPSTQQLRNSAIGTRSARRCPWEPSGPITFLPCTNTFHIGEKRVGGRFAAVGTCAGTQGHSQCTGLHRGRTQHMSLSAPAVRTSSWQ